MKNIKLSLFNFFKKVHGLVVENSLIRKIPGLSLIYDLAFKALWPYPEVLEIEESKMYLNVREKDATMRKTFQSYAISREWESATTKLFRKLIKKWDVVIDLGANIGYFTLLSARLVGEQGRVYSFEPEPKNFKYLKKNIELNGYKNVFPQNKAVSDKNGKIKLYICHYDSGHHTINQHKGIDSYKPDFKDKEEFVEIETVRLDDFLEGREQKVDVMKIDIEGAEMLALSGMDKTIKQNKTLKIFVEFFPLLLKEMGVAPEDFLRKILDEYRFSVFVIGHDYAMKGVSNKEFMRVTNIDEIMDLCKGRLDHLNLLLFKNNEEALLLSPD